MDRGDGQMKKYLVIFKNDRQFSRHDPNTYALIGSANTIAEAKALRSCSGDLVVDARSLAVVQDADWLFDWELNDETCYATRKVLGTELYNEYPASF